MSITALWNSTRGHDFLGCCFHFLHFLSPEFCRHLRREVCGPNIRAVGKSRCIFPITKLHDTWRSSLKCLDSIMILLLLKHSPQLCRIQDSHLQLLWNCIADQNIWGNHWEVSIIFKIGMVSESVSWPLIWYLNRRFACGNSLHTIVSLLLNTMNMMILKIQTLFPELISLDLRLSFLTEMSKVSSLLFMKHENLERSISEAFSHPFSCLGNLCKSPLGPLRGVWDRVSVLSNWRDPAETR